MTALNTLYELLHNSIDKFGGRVAFSMYDGEDVTYNEVGKRVTDIQKLLTGAGLNAGDKVALLSSNMPNWGISYFAVVSAGMVAVPILPDFTGEELDMLIKHSEAKALLVSDKLFTKLSKDTIASLNIVIRTKASPSYRNASRNKARRRSPRPTIWRSSSTPREPCRAPRA